MLSKHKQRAASRAQARTLVEADRAVVYARSRLPAVPTGAPLDEPLLADDYRVYADYCYVVDGKVVRSDWHDISVRDFKRHMEATEVRRCDLHNRGML